MFGKQKKAGANKVRTHSLILTLERDGIRSKTGVINSANLQMLLEKYNSKNMRPVSAEHSKYCLCGEGKGEIAQIPN